MELKKYFFPLFLFFLFSTAASAQYGYGSSPYGYGSPYGAGGVDRSIGRMPSTPGKGKKKKEDKREMEDVMIEYLDKKLKLDDFQKAAIINIYKEHKASIIALNEEDMPAEGKKEKGKLISDKIDAQVLPLLNKEQAEKYEQMKKESEKQ